MINSSTQTPVEVWLTKKNIKVRGSIFHEDESGEDLKVKALNLRGAQREVTELLRLRGYEPVGRWKTEAQASTGTLLECSRQFR